MPISHFFYFVRAKNIIEVYTLKIPQGFCTCHKLQLKSWVEIDRYVNVSRYIKGCLLLILCNIYILNWNINPLTEFILTLPALMLINNKGKQIAFDSSAEQFNTSLDLDRVRLRRTVLCLIDPVHQKVRKPDPLGPLAF